MPERSGTGQPVDASGDAPRPSVGGTLLSIGIERIADHARTLSERVSVGLEKMGFTVISPQTRSARSGNTCFLVEDADAMRVRLAEIGSPVLGRIRSGADFHPSLQRERRCGTPFVSGVIRTTGMSKLTNYASRITSHLSHFTGDASPRLLCRLFSPFAPHSCSVAS